ncbi:MAG: methyltransferase domain-containing protein [Actinobacteria bacterium]|nr:methyltransferase domain-containing protein [Actinomycetota bacterium]
MATPKRNWFNPIAEFLGPAYLRNAFTKGTEQELEFLVGELGLEPGQRILDVGCGPGRHALALARRDMKVVGVDLSPDFIDLARDAAAAEGLAARFEVGDVRDLAYDAEFAAAVCLCQGGFGLLGGHDDAGVVERIVRAVVPGGAVAISAFSSYFALRHQEEGEDFDPVTGVHHEVFAARNEAGEEREFDAWTTCFTAREMALLGAAAGLRVDAVYGVTPGGYRAGPPALDDPEVLLIGRRPLHAGTA